MPRSAAGTTGRLTDILWSTSQQIPTFSNGYRLDADVYLPSDEDAAAPYPVVIACSGYRGLKVIHPEDVVAQIAPRPLLVVHGAENELYLPEEAAEMYQRAGEPKKLTMLEGARSYRVDVRRPPDVPAPSGGSDRLLRRLFEAQRVSINTAEPRTASTASY